MATTRRRFSAVEKASIVKRHLAGKTPISDLCDELRLQPTQIYAWQKQLIDNATVAFENPNRSTKREKSTDGRIAALEAKLRRKDSVMAQLLEEHFELRTKLGTR